MKKTNLKDIVKEIADNKDKFLQLREVDSPNTELRKIVQGIVKEVLGEMNEGRPLKRRFEKDDIKPLITLAVENLIQSGYMSKDPNVKQVLIHWLTEYTIELIYAITGQTIDYNYIRP